MINQYINTFSPDLISFYVTFEISPYSRKGTFPRLSLELLFLSVSDLFSF